MPSSVVDERRERASRDLCVAVGPRELRRRDHVDAGKRARHIRKADSGRPACHRAPRDAEQVRLNCEAVVTLCHAFLPGMVERRRGGVINVASSAGFQPIPYESVYAATKFGVVGFSQATQRENEGQGIQVTAFCPAFVDTPMTEFVKQQVAAEAMIRPEDIAEAVRFLLRTSPNCLVPEMVFLRPGDTMDTPELG